MQIFPARISRIQETFILPSWIKKGAVSLAEQSYAKKIATSFFSPNPQGGTLI
jgi:hypothetical protein